MRTVYVLIKHSGLNASTLSLRLKCKYNLARDVSVDERTISTGGLWHSAD